MPRVGGVELYCSCSFSAGPGEGSRGPVVSRVLSRLGVPWGSMMSRVVLCGSPTPSPTPNLLITRRVVD